MSREMWMTVQVVSAIIAVALVALTPTTLTVLAAYLLGLTVSTAGHIARSKQ